MNSISMATSALQAFSTSQQVTANNLANLNSAGFTASRTTFQDTSPSGVGVSVAGTQDTVDISLEATQLISNSQGFTANLKVLKTADEMTRELLDIKA